MLSKDILSSVNELRAFSKENNFFLIIIYYFLLLLFGLTEAPKRKKLSSDIYEMF
jgi:hypothetical protein